MARAGAERHSIIIGNAGRLRLSMALFGVGSCGFDSMQAWLIKAPSDMARKRPLRLKHKVHNMYHPREVYVLQVPVANLSHRGSPWARQSKHISSNLCLASLQCSRSSESSPP